MIEFELGDDLVSIKQIDNFKPFMHFKIKGCGDLSWRANTNKKGYGFALTTHGDHHTLGFFTEKEMSEYFITLNFCTEQEDYKSHLRNEKLKSLGV